MINTLDSKNSPYLRICLLLALVSLLISGLCSGIVGLLRIPSIYALLPFDNLFDVSLVIHVTFSINVFNLIFASYFFSESGSSQAQKCFLWITTFCIALITFSIGIPGSTALRINYVPILANTYFLLGLFCFLGSVFALCFTNLTLVSIKNANENLWNHLISFLKLGVLTSFTCLCIARILTEDSSDVEQIFWGFGHILQFVFVELGNLCILASFEKLPPNKNRQPFLASKSLLLPLSILKFSILIVAPFIYLSDNSRELFTQHMRWLLAIYYAPTFFLVLAEIFRKFAQNLWSIQSLTFLSSSVLALMGGAIGYMIFEENTTVPAHYHGFLIGITVSIIGFVYSNFARGKLSLQMMRTQILMYGFGHALHVLGLKLMGGYGALRKSPGDVGAKDFAHKIFYTGGGISLLGGILFLGIGFWCVFSKKELNSAQIETQFKSQIS